MGVYELELGRMCSSRYVIDLCLSGFVEEIAKELALQTNLVGDDVNQNNLLFILQVIINASQTHEFAALFTNLGGSKYLKFLMNDDNNSLVEDVRELVYEAYGLTSVASTVVAAASDIMPDRFTFNSSSKRNPYDHTIWLHKTMKNMHNEGMKATGYVMWSAAIILSQLLCDFKYLTQDKTVLEIGAGLGICSFMASSSAKKVTITDYNDLVLKNLCKNIQLNRGEELISNSLAITHTNCDVEAKFLDWDMLQSTNIEAFQYKKCTCDSLSIIDCHDIEVSVNDIRGKDETSNPALYITPLDKYDVIIGSDMCCCETDAIGIAKIVQNYLSNDGIVLFIVPLPQHRYGTEVIIPALNAIKGLHVRYTLFHNSSCTTKGTVDDLLSCWNGSLGYKNNSSLEPMLFDNIDFNALTDGIHDKEYVSFLLILAKYTVIDLTGSDDAEENYDDKQNIVYVIEDDNIYDLCGNEVNFELNGIRHTGEYCYNSETDDMDEEEEPDMPV